MSRILILTALAVAVAGPPVRAQQRTPAPARVAPSAAGGTAVNDSLFAEAAAVSGMAEVILAEIGVQRASDPELKKLSQQMIDDHTKMNQELMTLAARKRIAVPRAVDVRAQFCAQSLQAVPRDDFDKCYSKAQLAAHIEALEAFESEAERGQDPEMKALASRSLSHIKEHLKTIKSIAMKFEKEHSDGNDKQEK